MDKIKSEEKSNQIFLKFDKLKNIKNEELNELYKKLYAKTDIELNDLPYKDALKYDNRTFFDFYFSLLKCNHLLLFSFLPKFDFNSRIIKIYLFFFIFASFFFVNALFFIDETMGKINIDRGTFNFLYNLPQIIYSSIISQVINEFIRFLELTENSFIKYRNIHEKEKILKSGSKLIRIFKIKFVIFFISNFILLGGFVFIFLVLVLYIIILKYIL